MDFIIASVKANFVAVGIGVVAGLIAANIVPFPPEWGIIPLAVGAAVGAVAFFIARAALKR